MAERYVISRAYGELVEGWRAAREALSWAIKNDARTGRKAEEIAALSRECAEWQDCMRRCPVFVR